MRTRRSSCVDRGLALASVACLAAAATLQADVTANFASPTLYSYEFTHVPDLDQKRSVLPGGGNAYCVPTATINWMAYFGNHGWSAWIEPGAGNWQSQLIAWRVDSAIMDMGQIMGTSATDGTTASGLTAGLAGWQWPMPLYSSSSANSGLGWSPTFQYASEQVLAGGYVLLAVGWYTEYGDAIVRDGGHLVTLSAGARSGGAMEMSIRDPASDEGNPVLQGPFTTESYELQTRTVAPNFIFPRPMSKVLGYGSAGYIDAVTAIFPIFALTAWEGDSTFTLFGSDMAALQGCLPAVHDGVYQIGPETPLQRVVLSSDLRSVYCVAEPPEPGEPSEIWELVPVTGASRRIDVGVDGARDIIVGRRRGLYAIDGGDGLVRINTDLPVPDVVAAVGLPTPGAVMTYDDAADEVVVLSTPDAGALICRIGHDLGGTMEVLETPGLVAAEDASMCWDPARGSLWVCSSASHSVFQIADDPSGGPLIVDELSHPTLVAPRAISVADTGRLFVSSEGRVKEYEVVEGLDGPALVTVDNPVFAGADAGDFLQVSRSSNDQDPEIHDGPEWNDVPPEFFGDPVPDCLADLDGDGLVGVNDLLALLAVWGTADPFADIAPNGGDLIVDVEDLLFLLAEWGPCT